MARPAAASRPASRSASRPASRDGNGQHVVGLHDAHAWPELYFPGVGWVAFEPTPGGARRRRRRRGRTGRRRQRAADQPTSSADELTRRRPDATGGGRRRRTAPADVLADRRPQRPCGSAPGRCSCRCVPSVLAASALVLLAVPALTRLVVRRRRWRHTPTRQRRRRWPRGPSCRTPCSTTATTGIRPTRRAAAPPGWPRSGTWSGEPAAGAAPGRRRDRAGPLRPGDVTGRRPARRRGARSRAALSDGSSRWGRWRARLLPRSTRSVATGRRSPC